MLPPHNMEAWEAREIRKALRKVCRERGGQAGTLTYQFHLKNAQGQIPWTISFRLWRGGLAILEGLFILENAAPEDPFHSKPDPFYIPPDIPGY